MQYNFDCIIDRTQIDSVKWTAYPKDVLPLWVADSDFQSPEPVVAAVQKIVDTKVLAIPMATLVFSNVPLFPGASASTTSPSVNPKSTIAPP